MSSPHAPLVFRRSYSRAVKVVPVNTLADSVCIGWFKNFNYVYKITRSVVELNPTKKTAWKNRGASKSNKQCDLHTLHAIFITERILTNIKAQDKNVVHRIYYPILLCSYLVSLSVSWESLNWSTSMGCFAGNPWMCSFEFGAIWTCDAFFINKLRINKWTLLCAGVELQGCSVTSCANHLTKRDKTHN